MLNMHTAGIRIGRIEDVIHVQTFVPLKWWSARKLM